ncbi:MAG: prolipoprotein diacylglyceryl transferase [Bdellovibrio sp.]|nr:prolipoprotein diacylglyceryl transferase [Bdellovibrio sp.]
MIPYIQIPAINLIGPLKLQPFGVLVVTGVLLGAWLFQKRAKEVNISEVCIYNTLWWLLFPGFIAAHIVEVLFYKPEAFTRDGLLALIKFWDGISSVGGLLGAMLGLCYYFLIQLKRTWWVEADLFVQSLILGWIFGRLGCAITHDHPGRHTDFFLAVRYPDGPRHDLGFYEFLFTLFILFPLSIWLYKKNPKPGVIAMVLSAIYAFVRFFLDFLRVDGVDMRYWNLTPAQYGCIILMAFCVYFFYTLRFRHNNNS